MPKATTTLPAIVLSSRSALPSPTVAATAPLEQMLRLDQVLALLGCSRSTLYAGIAEGRYPEPLKNGRLSLWPTISIRNWMADASNFQSYVAAKTALPRGLGRSTIFAPLASEMQDVERAVETMVLAVLLARFRAECLVRKPSSYDVQSAAAVSTRLDELAAGAPGNIPVLKRWRPAARS